MSDLSFSWQNVVDANGVGISITGMLIVFTALSLITVFIALLPKVLAWLEPILPAERDVHEQHHAPPSHEEEVLAAIGFALHQRRGRA